MNDTIKIYVPDPTYDNPDYYPGLDENEASDKFREHFEKDFREKYKNDAFAIGKIASANIGDGADFPAIVAEIMPYIVAASPIYIFFKGKDIRDNIHAWLDIGKMLLNISSNIRIYFSRSAAFLIGLSHIGKITKVKSLKLSSYKWEDARFCLDWKSVLPASDNSVANQPPEEHLSGCVHIFKVIVNDQEFIVRVFNNMVHIEPQQQDY